MKNRDLERKIDGAFEQITPDLLDSVLSDCQNLKAKGTVIMTKQKKNPSNLIRRLPAIAAALLLVTGIGLGAAAYTRSHAAFSTVSLDVNPSVEITVNEKERVLNVTAKNEDGNVIIGGMDFTGSPLDVTVNALVGSMLQNGYLSEIANSILVSVDTDDAAKGTALRDRLTEEINALLNTEAFTGSVLGQTLDHDETISAAATDHGITEGKAQLIQRILDKNSYYTFDELAALSIHELNLLSVSGKLTLDEVTSAGTASDKGYIGAENALNAALAHAGVAADGIYGYEAELDYENAVMVYDIEFHADGREYEYDIHAVSGEVIKSKNKNDNDRSFSSGNASAPDLSGTIGEEAARSAVLEHSGVAEADARFEGIKLDTEHGILVFEIEFYANGVEYDYDVNAVTGEIVKYEYDADNKHFAPNSGSSAPLSEGAEKAKAAALAHAGLKADDVFDFEIELENKNGVSVYEIDFQSGLYEYEYRIDAETFEVLKHNKEMDL